MAKRTLEQKTDAAEIITLKSKNSKQRTEISRLTMALEKATKEKH